LFRLTFLFLGLCFVCKFDRFCVIFAQLGIKSGERGPKLSMVRVPVYLWSTLL